MARSAVVVDPEYLKHEPGEFHPERPERIRVLLDLAEKLGDLLVKYINDPAVVSAWRRMQDLPHR